MTPKFGGLSIMSIFIFLSCALTDKKMRQKKTNNHTKRRCLTMFDGKVKSTQGYLIQNIFIFIQFRRSITYFYLILLFSSHSTTREQKLKCNIFVFICFPYFFFFSGTFFEQHWSAVIYLVSSNLLVLLQIQKREIHEHLPVCFRIPIQLMFNFFLWFLCTGPASVHRFLIQSRELQSLYNKRKADVVKKRC